MLRGDRLPSPAVEGVAYPEPDPTHERCLECFAVGWHARDAEVAQLVADRDRLYRHAYDRPGDVQRRIDRAFAEADAEFFLGAS